jgi:hypothetical protein
MATLMIPLSGIGRSCRRAIQLEILGGTQRAPQFHTVGLALGQSLFCAGADEIALDLGHRARHGGHDLGLHGVIENDAVIGDVQMDTTLDALPTNIQHLQRAARQARDFRHDNHVALTCLPDHLAQRADPPIGLAAHGVLDENRFKQPLVHAIAHDPVLLVGNVLGFGRDAKLGKTWGMVKAPRQ